MNPTNQPNQRETQPTMRMTEQFDIMEGQLAIITHERDVMAAELAHLREINKELLAELRRVLAILDQPWKDCNGPQTLQIAQSDCEIARRYMRAAIAKASPAPIEPTFTGRTIPATGGPWTGRF